MWLQLCNVRGLSEGHEQIHPSDACRSCDYLPAIGPAPDDGGVDEIDDLIEELTSARPSRPRSSLGDEAVTRWGRLVLPLAGVGALAIIGALGIAGYRVLAPRTESAVSSSLATGTAVVATGAPSSAAGSTAAPIPTPTTAEVASATTVALTPPYAPGEVTADNPDGALRYVVLQGGKLYLRGYVPTREAADFVVAISGSFIGGPANVVDEQLLDPSVPVDAPTAVYVRDVVLYDLNSTELRPDYFPLIDSAMVFLQGNPNLTITVVGRTDATGSARVNEQIGLARAQAIVDRLVAQGANPAQLIAESRGEADATPATGPVAEDRYAQIVINGVLGG